MALQTSHCRQGESAGSDAPQGHWWGRPAGTQPPQWGQGAARAPGGGGCGVVSGEEVSEMRWLAIFRAQSATGPGVPVSVSERSCGANVTATCVFQPDSRVVHCRCSPTCVSSGSRSSAVPWYGMMWVTGASVVELARLGREGLAADSVRRRLGGGSSVGVRVFIEAKSPGISARSARGGYGL